MTDRSRGTGLRWSSHGTVAELFTGRHNSLGFMRLFLACGVVLSHAASLGFNNTEFGHGFSRGQTDIGKLSVYAFFILSGILVTRSGVRLGLGRFLWHRALRLLPGLWVCILVCAFVLAPVLYWHLHGSLDGFIDHAQGPFQYVWHNAHIIIVQKDISGVMSFGKSVGLGTSDTFNGPVWTLHYEVMCYLAVGVLAATGALKKSRRLILLITVFLGWRVIREAIEHRYYTGAGQASFFRDFTVPIFGYTSTNWYLYLGFAFALGAVIELYKDRIPVNDVLGIGSIVVLLLSLRFGYLFVVGIPAMAYGLTYVAIRLPKPFQRICSRNDYSYGIYIYGWAMQMTLILLGGTQWGFWPFLLLSYLAAGVMAYLSWHLVEKRAMRFKDLGKNWTFGRPRPAAPAASESQGAPVPVAGPVPEKAGSPA
ncbi:acyltransferase [Streptomyces venezuelae]|uniref:Acyltransferase n=1 Tax=Streptomyces venezuelae TaxID=54571 RepID=A0A5P2D0D3_STRVZ|nr:acyltransferase [Streptomyces venezuelae]QES48565.1 acyltransferase [Streptomyces venezuelae]